MQVLHDGFLRDTYGLLWDVYGKIMGFIKPGFLRIMGFYGFIIVRLWDFMALLWDVMGRIWDFPVWGKFRIAKS